MPIRVRLLLAALVAVSTHAAAQDAAPKQQPFAPQSVPARVVIMVSGQSGMPAYTQAAQGIADAGFADRRYLFESLDGDGFHAELSLDDDGLVLDYPDLFQRVDP